MERFNLHSSGVCRVHTTKSNTHTTKSNTHTTTVALDTWNVSIYTHHGYKYYMASPLINHRTREFSCSFQRKQEVSLTTQVHTKNAMFIFITYHLSFEYHGIYYTNTISNQITGNYRPHKTTLYNNKPSHIYHQWHSRFCKMLYQKVAAP